jgi:hypothetical protein
VAVKFNHYEQKLWLFFHVNSYYLGIKAADKFCARSFKLDRTLHGASPLRSPFIMLRALKANNRSNFDSRPSNCYRCGFWPPGAYNFIENQGLLLICTVYYTGRPVNICPRQTPYLSTLKISWNENNIIFRKFPVLSRWYQKFIGVVSTKIEILFFKKKVSEI